MVVLDVSLSRNKRTNQLSLVLPKKKLDFLKDKSPKRVRLNVSEVDFKW